MKSLPIVMAAVVVCLPLLASAAYAEPTALGDTGLIFTPSADVQEEEVYDVFARNLTVGGENRQYISACFGIDDQFEVSAAQLLTPPGSVVAPATFINVKYRFEESRDIDTPISIGIRDLIGRGPNGRTYYVVATNYFDEEEETTSRLTFGVAYSEVNKWQFLVGLDGDISDNWRGLVEWDGQNINLGFRYLETRDEEGEGLTAEVFLQNAFAPGGNNVFLGVGYRWCSH